jgi:hypothetical protein
LTKFLWDPVFYMRRDVPTIWFEWASIKPTAFVTVKARASMFAQQLRTFAGVICNDGLFSGPASVPRVDEKASSYHGTYITGLADKKRNQRLPPYKALSSLLLGCPHPWRAALLRKRVQEATSS